MRTREASPRARNVIKDSSPLHRLALPRPPNGPAVQDISSHSLQLANAASHLVGLAEGRNGSHATSHVPSLSNDSFTPPADEKIN
jgi:hypothetical protein